MRFPHLTEQTLTLDGSWQEIDHHYRFTGILSSLAPFVILSLLKYSETYHMQNDENSKSNYSRNMQFSYTHHGDLSADGNRHISSVFIRNRQRCCQGKEDRTAAQDRIFHDETAWHPRFIARTEFIGDAEVYQFVA
jgi:hypothetical protein